MDFLVVMYGCESWTIRKAEHQRINASELWMTILDATDPPLSPEIQLRKLHELILTSSELSK